MGTTDVEGRSQTTVVRGAVALAAASVGLHLVAAPAMGAGAALPMIALVAVCVYCARHLWLTGSTRAWAFMAACSLGMVAVHLVAMYGGAPGPGTSGDMLREVALHRGAHGATHAGAVMHAATITAFLEVLLASAVLASRWRASMAVRSAPALRSRRRSR